MKTTYYTFLASILVIATLVGNTALSKETPTTVKPSKLIVKKIQKTPQLKESAARAAAVPGEGGGGEDGGSSVPSANDTIHIGLGVSDSITPETTDLLGERIDLNTGALSFSNVDASLSGNDQIPMQIARVFKGSLFSYYNRSDFGDWTLDIPHIRTTSVRDGRIAGPWGRGQECSGEPENESLFGVAASEYYNGESIHIPGNISEEILYKPTGKTTKSNWKISCARHGSGEKFIVKSPNGITYTFARKVIRNNGYIGSDYDGVQRIDISMYVTNITDRFGNTISYNYNSSNSLTSIAASDGRYISMQRDYPAPHNKLITSINVNGRKWSYNYSGNDTKALTTVTRPDAKQWKYDLARIYARKNLRSECSIPKRQSTTGTVTHPNGVKGGIYNRSNITWKVERD